MPVFILGLIFSAPLFCEAQNPTDLWQSAREASENENFSLAIDYYHEFLELTGNRSKAALPLVEAYYYQGYFSEASEELYFLREQSQKLSPQILWWEARVLHAQNRFSAAADQYKVYWQFVSGSDRRKAERFILDCENGKALQSRGKRAFVQNMGAEINSIKDELAPTFLSLDGEKGVVYSREGYSSSDSDSRLFTPLFASQVSEKPKLLPHFPFSEGLVYTINPTSGSALVCSGARWPFGTLNECIISNDATEKAQEGFFSCPASAEFGDTDFYLTSENCVLFAAQVDGGAGGYDIYKSCKTENSWTTPVKLPGNINSSWHERSPSLHPNGKILFFSSDRPNGLGGYDIYYSLWNGYQWEEPNNIGVGVNSLSDELFFRWGEDEYTAYFVSDRPGAVGGFDLFQAYFKEMFSNEYDEESVAAYAPSSTSESASNLSQPIFFKNIDEKISSEQQDYIQKVAHLMMEESDIDVNLICRSKYDGPKKYDLFFSLKKARELAKYLNELGVSAQRIHLTGLGSGDFDLKYSKESEYTYRIDFLFSDLNSYVEEQPTVSSSTFNDRLYNKDFFYLAPDSILGGLTYSVQVAAFRRVFGGDVLVDFNWPVVKSRLDKDVNKYTVGLFTTYREAKNLRRRLLASGFKGAFIVANIDGIRKTRGQLHPLKHKFKDLTSYIYVD
ncbi:MAG: hypothetical protein GVX96_06550 [Bacteroidetes bacterium]|jgi:hypothetical protein|nr:hypothetical protein [Bacteroidota bacterium]